MPNTGMPALADWEVRMMREYRQGGWSHKELAFFFEVSQGVVSRICRGQAYREAGGPIEDRYVRRS